MTYEKEIENELNDFLFDYGGSYTANGIQVIEYANMCEILRMNYMGVNDLYGLGIDNDIYSGIFKDVKQDFTTETIILHSEKQKYSDAEITSALRLILFGNGSLNDDNTVIKSEQRNNTLFNNISDIPADLRYQCFDKISRKTQNYPGSKNKIDIKTEFNIAVGNIYVNE